MRTSPADVQELRDTVMQFITALNAHDADRTLEFFTEDARWIQPSAIAEGKQAIRDLLESMWESTNDMHLPLDDVEFLVGADGDNAATLWRATMTMTGSYQGFAPTGRRAEHKGMCHYRMKNGKIAEHTLIYDEMALARQFGLVPATESRSYRMMTAVQRLGRRLSRS